MLLVCDTGWGTQPAWGSAGGLVWSLCPVSPFGHVLAMVPEGAPGPGRELWEEMGTEALLRLLIPLAGVMFTELF